MKTMARALAVLAMLAWQQGAIAPVAAQGVSPSQMFGCNQSAQYDASTNGNTRMVVGVAKKQIYVCGWHIVANGAVNVSFVYGTGGTCGSGTGSITPAWELGAQSDDVDHLPVYTGAVPAPASNDVCIKTSGAVAVQAILYFTQF